MSVRVENVSKSLTYVSVEVSAGKHPVSIRGSVKTYAIGTRVVATTVPHAISKDDLIPCTALAPGESLPVDVDHELCEFAFVGGDKDSIHLCVEKITDADSLTYRLHDSGVCQPAVDRRALT